LCLARSRKSNDTTRAVSHDYRTKVTFDHNDDGNDNDNDSDDDSDKDGKIRQPRLIRETKESAR
jgi:hypothetical protein